MKLIIVAHPDDELVYFMPLLNDKAVVVCVTDGNADRDGERRRAVLKRVQATFGFKLEQFMFRDRTQGFDRDEIERLCHDLRAVVEGYGPFAEVYSHGPKGEYGHPQHVSVSWCSAIIAEELSVPHYAPAFDTLGSSLSVLADALMQPEKYAQGLYHLRYDYRVGYEHFVGFGAWAWTKITWAASRFYRGKHLSSLQAQRAHAERWREVQTPYDVELERALEVQDEATEVALSNLMRTTHDDRQAAWKDSPYLVVLYAIPESKESSPAASGFHACLHSVGFELVAEQIIEGRGEVHQVTDEQERVNHVLPYPRVREPMVVRAFRRDAVPAGGEE